MAEPKFLPLSTVEAFEDLAKERGVSKVARSAGGFLPAYKRAGGKKSKLSGEWRSKREGFVARHEAQQQKGDEALFDDEGMPTDRHLAMIVWAYSPAPGELVEPGEEENPAEEEDMAAPIEDFVREFVAEMEEEYDGEVAYAAAEKALEALGTSGVVDEDDQAIGSDQLEELVEDEPDEAEDESPDSD